MWEGALSELSLTFHRLCFSLAGFQTNKNNKKATLIKLHSVWVSAPSSYAWHLAGILPSTPRGKGEGEQMINKHVWCRDGKLGGGDNSLTRGARNQPMPVFKAMKPENLMWIAPNIQTVLKTPMWLTTDKMNWSRGKGRDEGVTFVIFWVGTLLLAWLYCN